MLGLFERRKARRVARHYWIVTGGKMDQAMTCFDAEPMLVGTNAKTLEAMRISAILLWEYWQQNGVQIPSEIPASDEPTGDLRR